MPTGSAVSSSSQRTGERQTGRPVRGNLSLWALLFLAFVLRIIGTWRSLNLDEIASLEYSGQPFASIFGYIVANDTHPPLYYLLLHFWRYLGSSEVWIRLPNVLLGVGVCYLSYLLALQFVSRSWALLALLLAATAPSLIFVSQLARNYTLMSLSVGLSTYCMIRLIKNPRPVHWIGYVLAAAAGIYSFYMGAYILLAQNAAFVMSLPRGWRPIRNWILAQAAVIMLFAPWIPSFLAQAGAVKVDPTSQHGLSIRTLAYLWPAVIGSVEPLSVLNLLTTYGFSIIEKLVIMALTGIAVLASARAMLNRRREFKDWGIGHYRDLVVFTTIIVGVAAVAVVLKITRNVFVAPHYFAFLSTFGCVLAVMLLSRVKLRAAYVTVGVICLLQLLKYGHTYAVQEDWRGACRFLDSNLHSDSCLVTVSYHSAPCIRYYARGDYEPRGLPFDIPGVRSRPAGLEFVQAIEPRDMAAIDAELSKHSTIYMVWSHVQRGPVDRGEKLMKRWFVGNGYEVVDTHVYPGVIVEQYDRS